MRMKKVAILAFGVAVVVTAPVTVHGQSPESLQTALKAYHGLSPNTQKRPLKNT